MWWWSFPWLCSNKVTHAQVWYGPAGSWKALPGSVAAPHLCRHQPFLWQDSLWPLGLCHCPGKSGLLQLRPKLDPASDISEMLQSRNPRALSRSPLWKFFHHWPELEEGATGLSYLQVPDPVAVEVFSPASPHRYFLRWWDQYEPHPSSPGGFIFQRRQSCWC